MKSITIHGIDEPLANMIQQRAKAEGLSVNKTVKAIIEEALGVKPRDFQKHLADFKSFCGVWSKEEIESFFQATEEFNHVDPADWK